ncbi:MAG: fumarylacetoacetate hydrolase family protein [bacterium]
MSEKYIRFRPKTSATSYYGQLYGDSVLKLDRAPWHGGEAADEKFNLDDVVLAAPVEPSKIVCVGLNYQAHVTASQSADKAPEYPLLFLKPPSSLIGHEGKIVHPEVSERVDYEAELGVVIGRTACKVSVDEAADCIFGLTCVNDVTARDLQKKDGQWSRAKGFDTFCPVGPHIVTDVDYGDLLVEGILNGKVMQSGRTSMMIFPIEQVISYISRIMTLNPGDLVSTGTPAGIAPMKSGDEIVVSVENVGRLRNVMA